jgi:ArsR family transcriptional regulator
MPRADLFDRLTSLADPTRSRLLFVLDRHELTVGELCTALQLPQSTVSRHLKQLSDHGWVTSHAEGTSRLYRMVTTLEADAGKLWGVVREQLAARNAARRDAERAEAVMAERRKVSEALFSSAAGQWDALREELIGRRAELAALPALLDPDTVIGDLGCGTGQLSATLAPFVSRVVAVDSSKSMIAAARKRLANARNVDVKQGTLEALPIDAHSLDAAILFLVLHYVVDPVRVLREASRVLKASGRLVIVDMLPHDRAEYRERMGHLWQGFGDTQVSEWLTDAGFTGFMYHPLPVDAKAAGPALFAARAQTGSSGQ